MSWQHGFRIPISPNCFQGRAPALRGLYSGPFLPFPAHTISLGFLCWEIETMNSVMLWGGPGWVLGEGGCSQSSQHRNPLLRKPRFPINKILEIPIQILPQPGLNPK